MRFSRLVATIGFGILMFSLVWVSVVVTLLTAGAGHNPVVIEHGQRVAHFGWPFRFATSDMEDAAISYSPPDGEGISVGTDGMWNPYQIPTQFDETALRRSSAASFGMLASFSLLLWALAAARRRARARPPRPSARPC